MQKHIRDIGSEYVRLKLFALRNDRVSGKSESFLVFFFKYPQIKGNRRTSGLVSGESLATNPLPDPKSAAFDSESNPGGANQRFCYSSFESSCSRERRIFFQMCLHWRLLQL